MSWLPLFGVFFVGLALGAALSILLRSRRADDTIVDAASRASAAEAALEIEQKNLHQLEAELNAAQGSLREMDRQVAVATERESRAQQMIEELKEEKQDKENN